MQDIDEEIEEEFDEEQEANYTFQGMLPEEREDLAVFLEEFVDKIAERCQDKKETKQVLLDVRSFLRDIKISEEGDDLIIPEC